MAHQSKKQQIIGGLSFGTSYTRVAITRKTERSLDSSDFDLFRNEDVTSPIIYGYGLIANIPKIQLSSNPRVQLNEQVLGEIKNFIKSKSFMIPDYYMIAVPGYFNDSQRQETAYVAQKAQIPVIGIVTEPISIVAAIQQRYQIDNGTVLIVDFGGGSLDVSIVEVEYNKYILKAATCDSSIGGEAIDALIIDEMVTRFRRNNPGKDPRHYPNSMAFLKLKAEEAKIQLSSIKQSTIVIPNFVDGITLNETLTRSDFDSLCDCIIDNLLDCIDNAFDDALISQDDITHILLVGGSSKIPDVKSYVTEYFDERIEPLEIPDKAIAVGAAILCNEMLN